MKGFISQKAQIEGCVEPSAVILGETVVGSNTFIDRDVIIGYPVEDTLRILRLSRSFNVKGLDDHSRGAKIGRECIIRSGTVIYETATLGDKVRTGHNVLVREGTTVREETLIGTSVKLDGAVKIGRRVKIQSNAYLPHLTVIEDDVFIAPNVCFTNDPYPQSGRLVGSVVEKNAVICANATLLPGVRIGQNAVVAAGSVVTKNVAPSQVVAGNPARFLMSREEFDRKRQVWEKG
ncbi:N-acetyltransferase [Candidatus Bathyarchaeota archaeon]|nr:MAG: N-acetyltransferase [Candidatus Bathyarchaeota archaeon]